ncbi:hypothetical protein PWT90_10739 [Aphanocladium album]|nr:hypothetical protein PWT90_10739 [Aphanocladium album]
MLLKPLHKTDGSCLSRLLAELAYAVESEQGDGAASLLTATSATSSSSALIRTPETQSGCSSARCSAPHSRTRCRPRLPRHQRGGVAGAPRHPDRPSRQELAASVTAARPVAGVLPRGVRGGQRTDGVDEEAAARTTHTAKSFRTGGNDVMSRQPYLLTVTRHEMTFRTPSGNLLFTQRHSYGKAPTSNDV